MTESYDVNAADSTYGYGNQVARGLGTLAEVLGVRCDVCGDR